MTVESLIVLLHYMYYTKKVSLTQNILPNENNVVNLFFPISFVWFKKGRVFMELYWHLA